MASLDTNCLLRWLLGDLPDQQSRVEALLEREERLVVDDVVLIEAIFVMESGAKLRRATICELLSTAMAYPLIVDRQLWTAVLDIWVGHPKLSAVDVYLTVKAESVGEQPVYTFDTKMAGQLAGAEMVPMKTGE